MKTLRHKIDQRATIMRKISLEDANRDRAGYLKTHLYVSEATVFDYAISEQFEREER